MPEVENPVIEMGLTDTIDGKYVVVVQAGHGISLDPSCAGGPTWQGVICFQRASDGRLEQAASYDTYYQRHDPSRRRCRMRANANIGRYRSYLKRTGQRFEVVRRREYEVELARKAKERDDLVRIKRAGPDLLMALKALLEDATPERIEAARSAVSKAEGDANG